MLLYYNNNYLLLISIIYWVPFSDFSDKKKKMYKLLIITWYAIYRVLSGFYRLQLLKPIFIKYYDKGYSITEKKIKTFVLYFIFKLFIKII